MEMMSSQRAPKKNNVKNKKPVDINEEQRRVAELTSIIRVTNFSGTIRAWKVSTLNEKETNVAGTSKPYSPKSTPAKCSTKPISIRPKYKNADGEKKIIPVARVQPSILRRELRKKHEQSRLLKVLELNRQFLLNPILHIHFVVRNVLGHENGQASVAPTSSEFWSWENVPQRVERDCDPTLPILPDPTDDTTTLEACSDLNTLIEDCSNWTKSGEWILDPYCSLCGRKNHFDLPSVLAVNRFHPDESCVSCGFFHPDPDPCNMGVMVNPILNNETLL